MADTKPFLSQTAQTASFAVWEFFRPLIIACRFLKARLAPPAPAESASKKKSKKKCQEPFPDGKGS